MTSPAFYDRYDRLKRYARVLFRPRQFIETAEWNELQSIQAEREAAIGDSAFGAISLREGGTIVIDQTAGTVRLGASKFWAGGFMHQVPAATLTAVPMVGTVIIGIAVTTVTVTEVDDPDLYGIVPGVLSQGKALAMRQRFDAVWARSGDPFYPWYTIVDGILLNEQEPPSNDGAELAVERHVDETHGSHIITGFDVTAAGFDAGSQEQSFVIRAGVLRAQGRRVSRSVDSRFRHAENPALASVVGEIHNFVAGGVIALNSGPVSSIELLTVTKEITETVTHALAGGSDALAHTPVYSIVSVAQGSAPFAGGTYQLTADKVDWSPAGAEPSPGSSYQCTYRYTEVVAPVAVGRQSVSVPTANAVVGLPVRVDYKWKLNRVDVLAVNLNGEAVYLEGLSTRLKALPPPVPFPLAPLVRIENKWGIAPVVTDMNQRRLTEADLQAALRVLLDLADQVSRSQMLIDIQERDPASRKGFFVDPFTSDIQRDLGIPQTAACVDGILQLPIAVTPQFVDLTASAIGGTITLPFVEEIIFEQPFRTATQKINEYQAFEPLPGSLSLNPAVDQWSETNVSSAPSISTSQIVRTGHINPANQVSVTRSTESSSSTSLVSSSTVSVAFLRQISVSFTASRFGPGENIASFTFDSIPMSVSGTANAQGQISGAFVIPAGVPTGTKQVVITGQGGTRATATFIGSGTITTLVFQTTTNTLTTEFYVDPVAQTFKLDESRLLTAFAFEFTGRGSGARPVVLDLRPVENGLPLNESIAEGIIAGSAFAISSPNVVQEANWSKIGLNRLTHVRAGEEHAAALLTDDPAHAIAYAQLGDQSSEGAPRGFDARRQKWIGSNPYGGVMLTSSNASTWLPKPEADMTIRAYAARFTSLTRSVQLFQGAVVNLSDILVALIIERPSPACTVKLELVRASGEVIAFEPNERLALDTFLNEAITIRMVLTGTATLSPIVQRFGQIMFGTMATAAIYVSEAIAIDLDDGPVKLRTVLEANAPGTSTIAIDTGGTGSWVAGSSPVSEDLGDGWIEREYLRTPYSDAEARIRINLAGTPKDRPRVRQLRARATEV